MLRDFEDWTTDTASGIVRLAELLAKGGIILMIGALLDFLELCNRSVVEEKAAARKCDLILLKARLMELGHLDPWR